MRYTLRQRFLRFLGAYVEAVAIWLMERAEPDEPVRMFGCQIVERLWDGEGYFEVEGDWGEHFKTHVPGNYPIVVPVYRSPNIRRSTGTTPLPRETNP